MHEVRLPRHPNHWMRDNLTGLDDAKAMALIEPAGAGIRGVVDQAQAVERQLIGPLLRPFEKACAEALVAPAFMQGQA